MKRGQYEERIGEGLVRIGAMSEKNKDHVLDLQRKGDKRLFGEIAVELGYVDIDEVVNYLSSINKVSRTK